MTKTTTSKTLLMVSLAGLLAVLPGLALADWSALNLPPGVTPLSHQIYALHMKILWICVIIGTGVFGVMFWSIFHHRKSRGAKAAHFHENTTVEIIWTLIPMCILVFVAVPATKTLINIYSTGNADLTIKATGYQWKWQYDYLDQGLSFFSTLDAKSNAADGLHSGIDPASVDHYLRNVDHPMVVPVGKKIRLLTTGGDVIHSWWVPDLGVKRDGIPGFINEGWFKIDKPGTYRGQCAELCGRGHGYMPIVVVAESEADFKKWVADTKAAQKAAALADNPNRTWKMDELMEKGKEVYTKNCAACHQAKGQGIPGTVPALAGSKIATGDIDAHIDRVLNGKPGTAMVAWKDQLSDTQIAAVVTYERNAFGNKTGDVVQPSSIKDYR